MDIMNWQIFGPLELHALNLLKVKFPNLFITKKGEPPYANIHPMNALFLIPQNKVIPFFSNLPNIATNIGR